MRLLVTAEGDLAVPADRSIFSAELKRYPELLQSDPLDGDALRMELVQSLASGKDNQAISDAVRRIRGALPWDDHRSERASRKRSTARNAQLGGGEAIVQTRRRRQLVHVSSTIRDRALHVKSSSDRESLVPPSYDRVVPSLSIKHRPEPKFQLALDAHTDRSELR